MIDPSFNINNEIDCIMQINTDDQIVTVFIGTFSYNNWKSNTTGVLCFFNEVVCTNCFC